MLQVTSDAIDKPVAEAELRKAGWTKSKDMGWLCQRCSIGLQSFKMAIKAKDMAVEEPQKEES